MNLAERKYRFTEIVTAITLLPDLDKIDEAPLLPNTTQGLSDGNLKSALVSQSFREGEEFGNKLVNALVGSAMSNISNSDNPPSEDDMSAIGLGMSLAWAHGEIPYFLALSGLLSMIWEKNHDRVEDCEYLIPSDITAILGNGKMAQGFAKYEPYDLLEGKTKAHLASDGSISQDLLVQLQKAVEAEINKNKGGE